MSGPAPQLPVEGEHFGEFEVKELLGEGGFGAVYRAHQARLRRDVAIKVVIGKPGADLEDLARRFLREIDLVRRLEHPNVVRLYDFGRTEDDKLWMAMELVRGVSLQELLAKTHRLTTARARRITMQLLSGLAAAHEQNIVHRDLKPANIMLTRLGAEKEWVKVLDFGIGKAVGETSDGLTPHNLTETGQGGYGTPRYMAPEQIRNKRIGPHTDVYAVGLMMLEMITGRPAINGDTTYEVLANQIAEPILLPEELAAHPMGAILARAAAKHWGDRYADAIEFHQALESVVVEEELLELSTSFTSLPSIVMDTGRGNNIRGTSPELVPVGGETGQIPDNIGQRDASKRRGGVLLVAALAVLALAAFGLVLVSQNQEPAPAGREELPTGATVQPGPPQQPETEIPAETIVASLSNAQRSLLGTRSSQSSAMALIGVPTPAEPTRATAKRPKTTKRKDPPEPNARTADCTIKARSEPVSAAVFVGGKRVCDKTPCAFELAQQDRVKVEFRAPGYHSESKSVRANNSTASVEVRLVKSL